MTERNALAASLSPSDLYAYAEAAYGTPFEPYIKGQIAYGYPGGHIKFDGEKFYSPEPVSVTPSEESRLRYAKIFRDALYNPALAVGSDDPSRLAMIKKNDPFPSTGEKMWQRVINALMPAMGQYAAGNDVAVSSGGWGIYNGTDSHELMHRGLYKLGYLTPFHHGIIEAQNASKDNASPIDYNSLKPYPEYVNALAAVQDHAKSELMRRRPFGGPR